MMSDILVDFYLSTVKLHTIEVHLATLKPNDTNRSNIVNALDSVKSEHSSLLSRLIKAALPANNRNRRLFRTKYCEEVDVDSVEKNLVVFADKVVNNLLFSDYDTTTVRPLASDFLDKLTEMQYLLICSMEDALLSYNSMEKQQSTSVDPAGSPEECTTTTTTTTAYKKLIELTINNSNNQNQNQNSDDNNKGLTLNKITLKSDFGSDQKLVSSIDLPPISCLSISSDFVDLLLELDGLLAEFEFELVRCMAKRVRTVKQAEDVQTVTVLFSETLMWALSVNIITQEQLADRDPDLLLSLPRLAIFVGCRLLPDSCIGPRYICSGQRVPFMFTSCLPDLVYVGSQLFALRPDQLCRLVRWLGPSGLPNLILMSTSGKQAEQQQQQQDASHSDLVRSSIPEFNTTDKNSADQTKRMMNTNHNNNNNNNNSAVWRTHLRGLHLLFKSISKVAIQFARLYPTELRFVLQKSIEMHSTLSGIDDEDNNDHVDNKTSPDPDEVEMEFDLSKLSLSDTMLSTSQKQLSDLFDWSQVVTRSTAIHLHNFPTFRVPPTAATSWTHRRDQLDLGKVFKQSEFFNPSKSTASTTTTMSTAVVCSDENVDGSRTSCTEKQSCSTIFSNPQSVSTDFNLKFEQLVKQESSADSPLEIGLDVSTYLEQLNWERISPDNLLIPTKDKQCKDDLCTPNQKSFVHRLQLFNLGTAVDGTELDANKHIHYLPKWLPDNYLRDTAYQAADDTNESENEEEEELEDESAVNGSEVSAAARFSAGVQCARCFRYFTLIRRRHHCRRCGYIFCRQCANSWRSIEGLVANDKPVRICLDCFEFLESTI